MTSYSNPKRLCGKETWVADVWTEAREHLTDLAQKPIRSSTAKQPIFPNVMMIGSFGIA